MVSERVYGRQSREEAKLIGHLGQWVTARDFELLKAIYMKEMWTWKWFVEAKAGVRQNWKGFMCMCAYVCGCGPHEARYMKRLNFVIEKCSWKQAH